MITVQSNPISERYDRSPSQHLAAVRLEDSMFKQVVGKNPQIKSDGPVKFSDGGYGNLFRFQVAGRKQPLNVIRRVHKVDENDFQARTMFYVKHEDVPEGIPEVELQTGTRAVAEVDF